MDREQGPTLKGFKSQIRKFNLYPEGIREQIDPEQWQLGEGRTGNGNRSVLRMLTPADPGSTMENGMDGMEETSKRGNSVIQARNDEELS